jgi:hypothetical protein
VGWVLFFLYRVALFLQIEVVSGRAPVVSLFCYFRGLMMRPRLTARFRACLIWRFSGWIYGHGRVDGSTYRATQAMMEESRIWPSTQETISCYSSLFI